MPETKQVIPRTKIKEPGFIEFSKVQKAYIEEVLKRQRDEFNEIIDMIYDELGITEKILKAPPGTYKLRKDCSGLDILPVVASRVGKKVGTKKPEPEKEKTH